MAKNFNRKKHICGVCLYAGGSPLCCTASPDKRKILEFDKYTFPAWCPFNRRWKDDNSSFNSSHSCVAG